MPTAITSILDFESYDIGTLPGVLSICVFYSGGWVSVPDPKVASGGPDGYTKVLQLPAIDAFYRAALVRDVIFTPYSDNYCNSVILFRLLTPYSGTTGSFKVGNQLSIEDSPIRMYCGQVTVDSAGTDYTLVGRYASMELDGPSYKGADTDAHGGLSYNTWYFLRYVQNGTTLSVTIWEAGTGEPSAQSSGVSSYEYSGSSPPVIYMQNRNAWEIAAWNISFDPSTPVPAIAYGFTGNGAIDFSESVLLGCGAFSGDVSFSEAEVDGYGNFCGEVEHSDFKPDGYGNFEGSVAFPDAELAGESWVGGIGVIDFPEFGIHQAISGNGAIHEDTRDLFDYTGRSGALGSVSFSMGLRAAGSQLVSGNAETSFGTFTLDGDGNFSGAVSFEDTLIDASGSSFPVGRASIDWSISVGGAGKVGTVEAGSSPVEFPAFQISGAGTVRVVGHAAMDFERFEADGVALPGCSGDGVIVLPSPVVLASGQHPPRGDGAIEFSIDLPSSGCYGHSDRYRYPILRFERHP